MFKHILKLLKVKSSKPISIDEIRFSENNINTFFSNYVVRRNPVLIKGGIEKWPLMNNWSKEYIAENFGDYQCSIVNDSRSGASSKTNIVTTLNNYFTNKLGKSAFVREEYNHLSPPLFFKDIRLPNLYFKEKNIISYFFFHAPESGGALPHFHSFEVFNMLQRGKKKWIMFDADPAIAPKGSALVNHFRKQYGKDTHASDWFKYEYLLLTKRINPVYECIQEEGDIIYIPVNFCHAVLNFSESMGLIVETKSQ